MKIELAQVEKQTGLLTNVRGYGTHIGFDLQSEKVTDSLQRWLWKSGFNVAKVGPNTLGLRPSLTLGIEDAGKFRTSLLYYSPNFEK